MRISGITRLRCVVERADGVALLSFIVPLEPGKTVGHNWSPDASQMIAVTAQFSDALLELAERAGVSDSLKEADADAYLFGDAT